MKSNPKYANRYQFEINWNEYFEGYLTHSLKRNYPNNTSNSFDLGYKDRTTYMNPGVKLCDGVFDRMNEMHDRLRNKEITKPSRSLLGSWMDCFRIMFSRKII